MTLESDEPIAKRTTGEPRELTDPRELRALTHPVRIALLESLALQGPLTATEAGDLIGESPTTCSFHFRQLAKYGFVEEAAERKGRRRPWKLASLGLRVSDSGGDAEFQIAATALEKLMIERWLERFRAFEQSRHLYDRRWREAADTLQAISYLTPEELSALIGELMALFERYRGRFVDPSTRPPGALPVETVIISYPLAVPPTGTQDETRDGRRK
jgi:hypothetical protein